MHPSLSYLDHRPWPLPDGPWSWRQSWRDLLFIHWPVPADALRPLVPPELDVQAFGGTAWIGVVPFRMADVAPRGLPPAPWLSAFPEINVRVYVTRDDRPGVWFLSLDAGNRLAVWAAKRFFHLPYVHAHMVLKPAAGGFVIHAERSGGAPPADFEATFGPVGDVYTAAPGSLEHFLTERYCLYARSPDGALHRAEVHHPPWPLQPAQARILRNDLLTVHGVDVATPPALLHFARRVDVVVWPLEQITPS